MVDAKEKKESPLGVGIIGAGAIARQHLLAIRQLGSRARVVAIADVNEVALQATCDTDFIPLAMTDYRELLDRHDVDIVAICTPPASHEELVTDALAAGKYVLCEKPLAHTLASADAIIGSSAQFPGKLSTVYQLRHTVEMQKLVWLVENGRLGSLRSCSVYRQSPIPPSALTEDSWWGKWDVAGGGMVMTQFIHHLDQLLHLFGPAGKVQATMSTESQPIESEDTFEATITFRNKLEVRCEGTLNSQKPDWQLCVEGEKATAFLPWSLRVKDNANVADVTSGIELLFDAGVNLPRTIRKRLGRLFGRRVSTEPNYANSHEPYYRAVLDAIDRDEPLPIPGDDARASLELCAAIYASAMDGITVELPFDESSRLYKGITVDDYRNRNTVIK